VTWSTGRVAIDSTFGVAIVGYTEGRLTRAVDRALRRLEGRTGITFVRDTAPRDTSRAQLVVRAGKAGMAVQGVEEDESYALDVGTRVTLSASTVVGVMRGLETVLQLVDADTAGYYLPGVSIQDKPRFPWRGLLIDVCRHFQSVAVIERNLDAMAAVKLNVLHWHLSEDQGFRVESKKYPKLHQLGSDGLYYTQDEIREVVAYARDRGIRVVPEFDMPAHSSSWFVGYPQYASAPGPFVIERAFGVHDAVFDPSRDEVYAFIDGFIGEMAPLFPDVYFHIGGDEANGKEWNANARIQAFMRTKGFKDNEALQAYFNQRLEKILEKHNKHMVGWDEILHPDLPHNVVVQSWRGQASLAQGAKAGHLGILSAPYYLDAMRSSEYHYGADPLPDSVGLAPADAARVLGGEVCMWGEIVTPETIDSRIWPRSAAVAERFWSASTVMDVDDMYRRLSVVSVELEELGLVHESSSARLLRRLVPGQHIGPLVTLVSALEPVNLGGRMNVNPATQLTPLTALSDAAVPDPRARREVAALVKTFLANPAQGGGYRAQLTGIFDDWREQRPGVTALAALSPAVREALPQSADLADLGTMGLEAMGYLAAGTVAPADWKARATALLERAQQRRAHMRFAVMEPMRALLLAARP
jgi:hexosaminidase